MGLHLSLGVLANDTAAAKAWSQEFSEALECTDCFMILAKTDLCVQEMIYLAGAPAGVDVGSNVEIAAFIADAQA